MPICESEGEGPFNMCETAKLCQEEDTDHPRGNSFDVIDTLHTERRSIKFYIFVSLQLVLLL